MREIKFRGKTFDDNEWMYGYLRQTGEQQITDSKGRYLRTEKYYQIQDEKYMIQFVDKNTIGQYTGLKDQNGEEIYEGDILDNDGELWIVEYSEDDGMFILQCDNVIENFSNVNSRWFEIIGNIYENKNLLEGVEESE